MRRSDRKAGVRRALAAAALVLALVAPAAAKAPPSVCSAVNVNRYLALGQRTSTVDVQAFLKAADAAGYPIKTEAGRKGVADIIGYWNAHPELRDGRWLAYVLGTSYHETAGRMFPVRETLAENDQQAIDRMNRDPYYLALSRHYWLRDPATGQSYFGRGFVQLTFDFNYQRADLRFKRDGDTSYYANPALALDSKNAIEITFDGMIYGWFSDGNCLLRYFMPNQKPQWQGARKIINGTDRWRNVGSYAHAFWTVLGHLKS